MKKYFFNLVLMALLALGCMSFANSGQQDGGQDVLIDMKNGNSFEFSIPLIFTSEDKTLVAPIVITVVDENNNVVSTTVSYESYVVIPDIASGDYTLSVAISGFVSHRAITL